VRTSIGDTVSGAPQAPRRSPDVHLLYASLNRGEPWLAWPFFAANALTIFTACSPSSTPGGAPRRRAGHSRTGTSGTSA
jgi:hypothetical protein